MVDTTPTAENQVRPRHDTWGGADGRNALRQLADDIRARARFGVCAIEALRSDGMLEFVAIAGSPEGEAELLGQASPLDAMGPAFSLGAEYGAFTFVAEEWFTDEAAERITQHGWVPAIPATGAPDQWRAMDMLVARVLSDRGELRGLLYLDEPVSGQRLEPEELRRLERSMQLPLRAVLTTIEREELTQQVRLAGTAREVVRAASSRLGYRELLAETREHLSRGFRADNLAMLVHGDPSPVPDEATAVCLPDELHGAVTEAAARAWEAQTSLIVEPGRVWGDDRLDAGHRDALAEHLATHGAGTLVVIPVGAGPEPLGLLLIARRVGGPRWTENESSAALDVGHDLGRAILSTRSYEREVELIGELQRLDQYRSQLISTVSHEMKNPLGVILGHLELLGDLPDMPSAAEPSLRALGRSAGRLAAVVDDLLLLGRMENPDHPLVRVPVDLAVVVDEVLQDALIAADRQGVTLAPPETSGTTILGGDPTELLRLVSNLVSNAVKYSEPGGLVSVSVHHTGSALELRVADTGIGISEADQADLFSEFFRSTNPVAMERPGTGLGLTIVQRIVNRHEGRVEVSSTPGRGTTFTVTLPDG